MKNLHGSPKWCALSSANSLYYNRRRAVSLCQKSIRTTFGASRWQTVVAQVVPVRKKKPRIFMSGQQAISLADPQKHEITTESTPLICLRCSNRPAPGNTSNYNVIHLSTTSSSTQLEAGLTFPRSPLCFNRIPPLFFTATSKVLLCSSTMETLNSNLSSVVMSEENHSL